MIIYYSMMAWVVFVWGLKRLSEKTLGRKFNKVPLVFAILTFSFIIFWIGMRTGVGDTKGYRFGFENFSYSLPEIIHGDFKDKGFVVYQYLIKNYISSNPTVFLMITAIISGLCVMYGLYKHSGNFFYSVMLFLLSTTFFWMMNGIRQFLAAAILFAFSSWIEQKKVIPYMLVILFAFTMHSTSVLVIPIYFIVQAKPWSKRMIIFILLILVSLFFMTSLVSGADYLLEDTHFAGVSDKFANDDGVHPLRVVVAMVPVAIAFWKRKQLAQMNNRYINICINMSVVTAAIYFLGIFTSGLHVGRVPIYFVMYSFILLPYLFDHCFSAKDRIIMYVLCTIGYFMYFYILYSNLFYMSNITGVVA